SPFLVHHAPPSFPTRRSSDLFVAPDAEGLVVGVVDGDQQALGRDLPDLRQQFPGPGDGVALEVVAERPVAQHLEEGVVARGVAEDRKSTRLNSSHVKISYAVF